MSDITPADALRELGDDQAEYAAAAAKKRVRAAERDLASIRERWEKATPGPWALDPAFWSPPSWGETMHYRRVVHGEPNKISGIRQPIFSTNGATDGSDQARQNHRDASAVAAAPEDVAWLLAEVARRDKVLDEVRRYAAVIEMDEVVRGVSVDLLDILDALGASSAEVTP